MPTERIVIVGLGYVGLPIALAFARKFPETAGFDIDAQRIAELRAGRDRTREVSAEDLRAATLSLTSDPSIVSGATFIVVTVPTPIDVNRQPDLRPLKRASETIGRHLRRGAVVVYESTVYPGVTEEVCGPILERESGLRRGVDFTLGYSPERINPGDAHHRLEATVKVVAGEDDATLARVADVYGAIVPAGVHRAPSIAVAEAAKVIENTQRDLNIALMNELALIFDRLGLRTKDVLDAASTKWNFVPFTPGLVGGHCIGVDPYYLTAKAESVGYHPQVILAGRRINDGMGEFVAQRLVKMLIGASRTVRGARVAVLGLTFKENVPDLRNSRVPDIIRELRQFGVEPLVHDPAAEPGDAEREYSLRLSTIEELTNLDGIVLAVPHREYAALGTPGVCRMLAAGGCIADVKSLLDPASIPGDVSYWSL